jgi:hypothetical protein
MKLMDFGEILGKFKFADKISQNTYLKRFVFYLNYEISTHLRSAGKLN